ncbi:hypothetical protein CONCODRAFT_7000 [Conidiobolus coronatus NRRL 28638]|uniref:Cyclin-like domain-containing protein n=1 Tax=Conidiobolus coronatus (strain ATCC 28846 / CBS 209.66 / NRRL 28638) TaxID=796925 RepID=A0A137P632_CONC2|nr:hypothetical protein CONCODRAFT_7000 [Conidiobolus coronatus NRRL 28638]|eukprot:KXN70446.1 hypothetical protein CONCODRAFT_7000 [Conidiobolus coronatus NRRL 28638]
MKSSRLYLNSTPSDSTLVQGKTYFTRTEIEYALYKTQIDPQIQQTLLLASIYLMRLGCLNGFPRTTINRSLIYLNQLSLVYNFRDYCIKNICLACLFVACKAEDTVKKLKDIISTSNNLKESRFQQLFHNPNDPENQKSSSKLDTPNGSNTVTADLISTPNDGTVLDELIQLIHRYELMILELNSYNFNLDHPQTYVIKFGRIYHAPSSFIRLAWELSHFTYLSHLCLQYPPHLIACGSYVIATHLKSNLSPFLNYPTWFQTYFCEKETLYGYISQLIELLITVLKSPTSYLIVDSSISSISIMELNQIKLKLVQQGLWLEFNQFKFDEKNLYKIKIWLNIHKKLKKSTENSGEVEIRFGFQDKMP